MNRNQRRLGRVHQKRYSDYESKREWLERRDRDEWEDLRDEPISIPKQRFDRHDRAVSGQDCFGNMQEAVYRNEKSESGSGRIGVVHVPSPTSPFRFEVLSPQFKKNPQLDKFTTNKCCYVTPKHEDFGQLTEGTVKIDEVHTDTYQKILREQYGFDPLIPETITQLKELRKLLSQNAHKFENGSQCVSNKKTCATQDGSSSTWQNVDSADDIDKLLSKTQGSTAHVFPEVRVCQVPRIKVIAKKYSKYKKNNVEVRKLDEKVVCVEYDVFLGETAKPAEKLRAFFSIRPSYGQNFEQMNVIPSSIKNRFNISNEDLKKLNDKEIEMIDGKITENKTYLEDLKRILRRKQAIHAKKNKNSLDLMSLYEMAKRESPPLEDQCSNVNFFSKAELQEINDLILKKCASSAQGISRRTVKDLPAEAVDIGVVSQSIMAELLRDSRINK